MMGALVVGVLVGLVFPITLLVFALFADAAIVLWVVYGEWHDHWAHRIGHAMAKPFVFLHHPRRVIPH